jgi:heparosan-N-sulfate-glucuronate 5-epimerase
MAILKKITYIYRILHSYLLPGASQLTFWHGLPEKHPQANAEDISYYYMKFHYKAEYEGPFDSKGIPMLNYHGSIGKQYNPIAITQWGLGNYNLFLSSGDIANKEKVIAASDWLTNNLEKNENGIPVWMHKFDFEYFQTLKAPWYSGLAQGQGISLLIRAHRLTGEQKYLDSASEAFKSMKLEAKDGGVLFVDSNSNTWIEEYIVSPPTHILNGFIWALWGVYDLWVYTENSQAKHLWDESLKTISMHLQQYDNGFWSLYELSQLPLKMIASPFYHNLHITQLKILAMLSQKNEFELIAEKWEDYKSKSFNRNRALVQKLIFKLLYY